MQEVNLALSLYIVYRKDITQAACFVLTILALNGDSFVNYKKRQMAVRIGRFVCHFSVHLRSPSQVN